MTQDAASLKNLRDIVEPAPVSWWPMALGWWIVLTLLLIAIIVIAQRWIHRWQLNAYRRAALKELDGAGTAAAIDAILKRTALSVWPRATVAGLAGQQWCDWLSRTAPMPIPPSVAAQLTDIFRADTADTSELSSFARNWILTHKRDPNKES